MSKTSKPVFIAISVLAAAAVGSIDAALADAHEQARQLLQPQAFSAKRHFTFSMASFAPQDPHGRARRMLGRPDVVAHESDRPLAVVVAVKPGDFVDMHARASRLLSRPLAAE
jgi:hypothetical protein